MPAKDAVRQRILEAAKKRFKHYGYAKTSMAEIAADLQMSPGNLYRYFPGKIDIALAIADDAYEMRHERLAEISADQSKPTVERLRDLFHCDMVETYKMIEHDPRTFELAAIIKTERPEWVNGQLKRERELIDAILIEGNERGEFDVEDVDFTAEMLQAAMMKFRYPQLWSNLKLPALEREFNGVARLLLVGLAGKAGSARDCEISPAEAPAAAIQPPRDVAA